MRKNLAILASSVGAFKQGDVVPDYALAGANPPWLVENGLAEWSNDPATVDVDADSLAQAAPDATPELIKAHAKATADVKELTGTVDALHKKCLDLEAKNKALGNELAAKVDELAAVKAQREKIRLEFEDLKLLMETATDPKKAPTK